MKKSFADILQQMEKSRTQKIRKKLSAWAEHEDIEYISELSLEQCSSSECARHKLEVLKSHIVPGASRIVDLTCGLGVDSWAFSRAAVSVTAYERNPELAAATARNMARLGAVNIEIRNEEVTALTDLPECDIIYADPARRDGSGRKVFLLEDCSPDIKVLLPYLKEKAGVILFKLSPMADIELLAQQLGEGLREIRVVSLKGEVKELLCLLERGFSGEYSIVAEEISGEDKFEFLPSEEKQCTAHVARSVEAGDYLLEPGPALLKSGAFKLIAQRFGLEKLDASTHLYKGSTRSESALLKSFRILETAEFSGTTLKELKKRKLQAEVTARNMPMSSDELRKRIAASSGGNLHIFACQVNGRKLIMICEREA